MECLPDAYFSSCKRPIPSHLMTFGAMTSVGNVTALVSTQ